MDRTIAVDLAEVFTEDGYLTTLAWGDPVEVVREEDDRIYVRLTYYETHPDGTVAPKEGEGWIKTKLVGGGRAQSITAEASETRVLKVDFVDVQQGDAVLIETPEGKVVLVDGGENQLFARFLAGRYRGTSAQAPKPIDAIVLSHSDLDHLGGLSKIRESEGLEDEPMKQLFVKVARVFHNGLVRRRADHLPDLQQLGEVTEAGGKVIITGLVDDPRALPDEALSGAFVTWKHTLEHWATRQEPEVRRVQYGDNSAFDFLADEGISVQVLGPMPTTVGGVTGLEFLGEPKRKQGHPSTEQQTYAGHSLSHTVNGHSVVFRLAYGRWSFLFSGDLNEQVENALVDAEAAGEITLRSEVFKVPHHGSADFLYRFLEAVAPVVSVLSSGDESARTEYIHPRATLLCGLGRFGRAQDPVLFVTELVAFFKAEGFVENQPPEGARKTGEWAKRTDPFFAFSRAAFGIVRVRTDGRRLLVYTDSGQADLKEAYAYALGDDGTAAPQPLRRV